MRIAVTIFGSTISPLFDAAQRVLLVDLDQRGISNPQEVDIGDLGPAERILTLSQHKVEVLICGGISRFMHQALSERGVQVYPWISGGRDEVLQCLVCRFDVDRGNRQPILAVAAEGAGPAARVAQSFRSSSHFLLFDLEGQPRGVLEGSAAPGLSRGGGCQLAQQLIDAGVKVLLTGRCGPNALGLFAVAGIEVVTNVEGSAQGAARKYARSPRAAVAQPAIAARPGLAGPRGPGECPGRRKAEPGQFEAGGQQRGRPAGRRGGRRPAGEK